MVKINKEGVSLDDEQWKPIIGYEGIYEVSDIGRVKSLWFSNARIMKLTPNKKGYLTVSFYKDSLMSTKLVARVVARAFDPEYSEDLKVDHIKGKKTDNRPSQLRMVTNKENLRGYQKPQTGVTSKYRGVCRRDINSKWVAQTVFNKKTYHLGSFSTEKEAAIAWNAKATEFGYMPEALNKFME